ncbi:MAG: mechanosensitive ion channel domain-containing protein [Methylomonas sp.]|jgi:potassium efflux system protein
MKRHPFVTVSICISLLFLCINPLAAAKPVIIADIEQRIEEVKSKANLDDDAKNRILAIYADCLDSLKEAQAQETQAETFKQSISSLPLRNKQLERQITEADNNLKNRKQEKFAQVPTDELEQRLVIEKSRLSDLDAEISRIDNSINDQLNSPQIIREKITDIKNKQADAQQEQQTLKSPIADNLSEKEALQIRQEIRVRLVNATLKTLEIENISAPLNVQLLKNRKSLLSLQREQTGMLVADLDNFLLDRRQQEIDKEQAELVLAEKAAEGKLPLIRAATKENMRLNHDLQEITKSIEQYRAQKNEIELRYKQLEKDFQSAEQKINLAGLSPALGNLLREERRDLPRHKQYSALNDNIQNEIAHASLEAFKLEDAKKRLADVGQELTAEMNAELPADTSDGDKLKIRTELRMLLNDQKDLVIRLESVYGEYARELSDVDFSLQQMLSAADKFSAYLDERLLWVPSAPIIDKYYLKEIAESLFWLVKPSNWRQILESIQQGVGAYPLVILPGLIIAGLHWRLKAVIVNRLQQLLPKKSAAAAQYTGFSQTLLALACILLLSLSGPLLMVWLGGILAVSGSKDLFSHAFEVGLFKAAVSLTVLQFFFRLFKPDGIAEALFNWGRRNSHLFYAQFKWARFVFVPSIFIIAMTTGNDVFSEYSYALGRTALIVLMLGLAYMFHCFTHPKTGVGKDFYLHEHDWSKAMPYLGYALAVSMPLIIIGFAVAGYYQSALELEQKLLYTTRLIFLTVLFHELSQRWLAITQRKLALQNARQKRKQMELAASGAEAALPAEENLLDISEINRQSHKLLTTVIVVMVLVGCWIIWKDILPAFSVFDRIELWQKSLLVEGKETLQPITLTNLLISIIYAVLAFVFVSNFPALVDLFSTGKFQLTPGSRYALVQLMRYFLASITFLAIANELGGSWSQVQWLVAALSVGLGFGLQEIFANMVSGIIILFERPIRVGDTVTVGDVTGRVSRIQMRATHIVDWDRKELVVPNKIFITDRLVNWTLSDTVTRLSIAVGVGYGSEIAKVEQVIGEAINNTPAVLREPAASVLFTGFGDNALMFEIHVYVHELSERLQVKHSLHKNIYEALQANKIEIPFPQRDIHIRSVENITLPKDAVHTSL